MKPSYGPGSVWFNKEAYPEKHYRELMLFTPWRNEDTDLIGKYSSYREHYLTLEEPIQDQMGLYAVCYEELNNVHIQDWVVTVNYCNYSLIFLLKKNVVFAGKRVLYLSITQCI